MISVIIVGRNDNYGGHFEKRLFATTEYNLGALLGRGVDIELIFVEWNPVADRSLLSTQVAQTFPQARCFVVDGAVHQLISENRHIKVFEYHAKNVGAKRAHGDWLLLTNPDNYFGTDILDSLQNGSLYPKTIYRAGWVDIETVGEIDDPTRDDQYRNDEPPYCFASGDFLMCRRELFDMIGGFREDIRFTNTGKDSILTTALYERTGRVRKIGNTYHLSHGRDDEGRRRLQYDWTKADRRPQTSYGLDGVCIETEIEDRVCILTLPPDLKRQADKKKPVRSRVPHALRLPSGRPRSRLIRRWTRSIRKRLPSRH